MLADGKEKERMTEREFPAQGSLAAADVVPDWLRQRAASSPGHPAVVCGDSVLSFSELDRQASRAAGRLRRLGVRRGDRVALVVGNSVAFVELLHGAMRLGAVLVPLHQRLTAPEVHLRVDGCDAKLLCYDAPASHLAAALPGRVCVDGDALAGDPMWGDIEPEASESDSAIDLAALHTILYTSGSTGKPKGVCLTAGNHFWSAVGSAFNLGVHVDDRWLACLSFSHIGGLAILLRSVIYGTTAVVQDHFDPDAVNRAIDEQRVTIVSLVANMLDRVLRARGNRPYPPWLRCVLLGGGPAPRALLEECAARQVPVVQTYGLTEAASQVTTLAPTDALRKLGSAGRPLLTTEIRLQEDGQPVSAGEVGEIQVRGPTVSAGYTNGPAPARLSEGWLATGDLGRQDDDQFLYVVGRKDDRIITGGENVEPGEVEAVLESHPAVAEACVVGVPDEHWGEIVIACVRSEPGVTIDVSDIEAHARLSLAGFKIPRRVIPRADFPRTATGKLLRRQIRAELMRSS